MSGNCPFNEGKKKFIFQLFLENHGGTLVMGSAIVMGF